MSDAVKPQLHGRDHRPGGRDPIPDPTVEWATSTKTNASLSTTYSQVVFASIDSGNYDTAAPTFTINGSGNLELGKAGFYFLSVKSTGLALANGKVSVLFLDLAKISGTAGNWSSARVAASGFADASVLLRFDDTNKDYSLEPAPDLQTFIALADNATLPVEIKLQAYVEEDQVGVAHSEGDFRIWAARFGSLLA